jgi:uncharacterized RmlC-like cupin family protein
MSASFRPTCTVIHPQQTYEGKQGHTFLAGVSAESAGAKAICMHLLTLAPGERGHPHLHEHHETALYVLSGQAEVWYGEQLQDYLTVGAGDFLYIPAGMPHLPGNRSQTDSCLTLVARTDPNEQESVVLLPQLNEVPLLSIPDAP